MYVCIQERKIIKNEKRCRNGVPKSTQTRKDKSDGKYTKPHSSLHLFTKEQRCWDEAYNTEFVLSIVLCIVLRPGTRQRLATSINLRTDSCSHSCGLVLSQNAVICGLGMRLTVRMHT